MNIGHISSKSSDMEMDYTDVSGTLHRLRILTTQSASDSIFTILKNDEFCCELVKEEETWMEPFHGSTKKSQEYGPLIDRFFVFSSETRHSEYTELSIAL